MTAPSSIDPIRFLHEQLAQASPDLLRQMLTTFINTQMSAEADAVCGAGYGERTEDRTNTRNGYRRADTRQEKITPPTDRVGESTLRQFDDRGALAFQQRVQRHLGPGLGVDQPVGGGAGQLAQHPGVVEPGGGGRGPQ